MKKNILAALVIIAAVAIGFGAGQLYAAGSAGSQEDPLLTLGYLNDTFMPSLETYIQARVDEATALLTEQIESELANQPETPDDRETTFVLVTLYNGQTLNLAAGSQALLRDGGAVALWGLSDHSGGIAVETETEIITNHMYIAGTDGGGLMISSEEATLMINGAYELE